ncbi:MAG: TlpA family protein disulfide reductase, partial [Novosphingobium sp.]|nr:TlpA family protein disulfide reductase [Novosphingobium sp.]
ISQDMSEPGKVGAFLAQRGLARLPAWLDPENDVAFHYGVGVLPMSILYDADGREVWRLSGDLDWTSGRARQLLRESCRRGDTGC